MKIEEWVWLVAFLMGFCLFLSGLIYWLGKKGRRESHYAKAAFLEFLSTWILYIPQEVFNEVSVSNCFLQVSEAVLTALLRSFNVYNSDGYMRVTISNHVYFSSIYGIVRVLSNIALLLFVGGFLIKFLDGPLQRLKLSLYRGRYTYIFSECNDKTIAIAKTLPDFSGTGKRGKKNIVFACAERDIDSEAKERIDSIGGIFVNSSVTEIVRKFKRKSEGIEMFLFSRTEENNLVLLDTVCRDLGNHTGTLVRIYVELSETPWDLYDDYVTRYNRGCEDKIIINFIRTEENFVYNHLLKHSIFEKAVPREEDGEIKILIVGGLNERNLEMIKAVLHLSQMPKYRMTMMVIEDGAGKSRLRQKMPEVYEECDSEGDAIYSLHYMENIDYSSELFENTVEEFADFTFAFVNAGNDLMNINLAMRINAVCHRKKRCLNSYDIQVNVLKKNICDSWNQQLLEGIEVVGSVENTYDYGFITMSDIEKGSRAIHDVRYAGERTWESYCNNEYNRHSVYARTLSFKYKVQLIEREYDARYEITGEHIPGEDGRETNIWKIYEHMRWNMYTRTLGYRLCPSGLLNENGDLDKKVRSLACVHNDLVPFDDLSEEEQNKDALELTPAIVQILKSI